MELEAGREDPELVTLMFRDAQSAYTSYANQEGRIDGATLVERGETVESRARWANGAFITAGGLALTAAVMYLFTDWTTDE